MVHEEEAPRGGEPVAGAAPSLARGGFLVAGGPAQAEYELRRAAFLGWDSREAAARPAGLGLAGLDGLLTRQATEWTVHCVARASVALVRGVGCADDDVGRSLPAHPVRGAPPGRHDTGNKGGWSCKSRCTPRVSTERQEQQGTIASQLDALTRWAREQHHDVVDAYVCVDDGYSGTRLDPPGLDRLRDGAEAGAFEAALVLCPDRLARKYADQILSLEELERFNVQVTFLDQPLSDDPQARPLTQIQGAVAGIRVHQDRGTIPPRQALSRATRRGVLVEGPLLRLPADSTL